MKTTLLGGLALAALGLAITGGARAATQSSFDYGPAAGNCQGALPAFAGTLRARPLAIGNEGSTTAFVTCGPNGTDTSFGKVISRFLLKVGNAAAASDPVTISCTFVHGYGGGPVPVYVTKTATVAPGDSQFIDFFPSDLGTGVTLRYPQASCSLPPGALVHYTGVVFTYEIGN